MSSNNVPSVYRQIIDSVIQGVRVDFEDMGIEQTVLDALQQSWEAKLAQSHVADFESDERMAPHIKKAVLPSIPPKDEEEEKVTIHRPVASTSAKNSEDKKESNENEIGSDLDDSDEEDLEGDVVDEATGEAGDLVIALYDKVNRVKNKWKVSLRDGVINVKGKDYLFSKCQGEFEW